MSQLLATTALAKALSLDHSTISKQAAQRKIPVAGRDDKGRPLFDLKAVRQARQDLNPLMRRHGKDFTALQAAAIDEKRLRGRKLLGELAYHEGLLVLKSVVDREQTTMARRTRDAMVNGMAGKASAAHSFAGTPRSEADWRVWLAGQVQAVFNEFAATLALENDDEFDDEPGGTVSDRDP
jgi:hypothetical protein